MQEKTDKNFYCHDGSLAALVGRKRYNGKWALYSISEVIGMGNAEYKSHVLGAYYDEVVGFNSFSGTSYITTKTNNQWV